MMVGDEIKEMEIDQSEWKDEPIQKYLCLDEMRELSDVQQLFSLQQIYISLLANENKKDISEIKTKFYQMKEQNLKKGKNTL